MIRRRLVRLALLLAGVAAPLPCVVPREAHAQGKKEAHEELILAMGETKTISAAGVKSFSDGVPGVAEVRLSENPPQFVVVGRKAGNTTLLLIKNDNSQVTYDITVVPRSPAAVERDLKPLLEALPGLRLRQSGGRILIEGSVATEAELKRVQQQAQAFAGQVDVYATVGAGGSDRKLLIRLDFFFVQYEKTRSFAVGLGWPTAIGTQANGQTAIQSNFQFDFIAGTTTNAQATVVNHPLPHLDIAARRGWAKVIKQSTVVTANGTEATFNSGGEQNFIQNTGLTIGLVRVQFGTNVTVLPRYDAREKEVELKLGADVSDLTAPASGGTVPGRTTTKLDTVVTLRLGQALIVSGIHSQSTRSDIQGLPFISEIPVLGLLFGTHRRDSAETEGAIFVVPSVIDTVPKSSIALIKSAVGTFDYFSGDISEVDTYPKQPPSAN